MSDIRWDGEAVVVGLDTSWRQLLKKALSMLQQLEDDAAVVGRLNPQVHANSAREDAYREAVADELAAARTGDRERFAATLGDERLDLETAECWMRVVGDLRLAIATKHGADEEVMARVDDAAIRLVHLLGHVQDQLVAAVGDGYYGHY